MNDFVTSAGRNGTTPSVCPRGCVDTDGCGCEWNAKHEKGSLGVASETVSAIVPELLLMCAHGHRWLSDPESTRCPVCGTSTFKTVEEWREQEAKRRV